MADEGHPIAFNPQPKTPQELFTAMARLKQLMPRSTYDAGRLPSTNDDITQGWFVGSIWIVNQPPSSTSEYGIYRCFDNTATAAIWQKMVDAFVDYSGSGTVAGGGAPTPVADNQIARFDGTTGRIQSSPVLISDAGAISASVGDLSDVDMSTPPSLNQVPKWNGSAWVPGTAGDTIVFIASGSQAGAFVG